MRILMSMKKPNDFGNNMKQVRKLWAKMADPEWRVSAKALHVLHRFSNDGSSVHATNLKESVSVLRTHHDSRRKVRSYCIAEGIDNYWSSTALLTILSCSGNRIIFTLWLYI